MRRLLALSLLLVAPTALSAPPTPPQTVKYRHLVMEGLSAHMGAIGMVVKGESDRAGDVLGHATAIAELSKTMGALFPEGTGPGAAGVQTDAKAEVWTKKDEFAAAVKKLETASVALVEAAKTNDPVKVKTAMGGVGQSCGGCHDTFKVDDEHH
jgi:cytochrome c556